MGLELVELATAVEQRFEIKFPNRLWVPIRTTGQLIDHVCAAVAASADGRCASQHSFHRVRRVLVEAGLAREAVRPEVELEAALPKPERRRAWPQLARRLGVRRRLRRPQWVSALIAVAAVTAFALVRASAPSFRGALAAASAATVAFVGLLVTRPAATRLSGTIGDLAREAVPPMMDELRANPGSPWTRTQVAETIRQMVRELSGVREFSDDADFVKDLGMG